MENITITPNEDGTFEVRQGNKYCDSAGWDEMLALVSSLTMPEPRPCLQWMRTDEDHKAWRESMLRKEG